MYRRRTPILYLILSLTLAAGTLYAGRIGSARADVLPPATGRAGQPEGGADAPPEDITDTSRLPATKVYKNVKVFTGMTAGELRATMDFMNASLGVRCNFCHVKGEMASDDKPEKNTARGMIHMTNEINDKNFGGLMVTCFTCHNGRAIPIAVPTLNSMTGGGSYGGGEHAGDEEILPDSTTTAKAVLDRYVRELGGEAALAKITSRTVRATETGGKAPAEVRVLLKAPRNLRSTVTASGAEAGTSVAVYDGRIAWVMSRERHLSNPGSMELEQIVREAELFPALHFREKPKQMQYEGRERKGDREYQVVFAARGNVADRLFFDAATGLLARRYVQTRTPLGVVPFRVEYSDYRTLDGVKVPYTVQWITFRGTRTTTITEVQHNTSIPNTEFDRPR